MGSKPYPNPVFIVGKHHTLILYFLLASKKHNPFPWFLLFLTPYTWPVRYVPLLEKAPFFHVFVLEHDIHLWIKVPPPPPRAPSWHRSVWYTNILYPFGNIIAWWSILGDTVLLLRYSIAQSWAFRVEEINKQTSNGQDGVQTHNLAIMGPML